MDKKTEISAIVLREAKKQFYSKEIDIEEYQEILTFLYDNLTDLEEDFHKKSFLSVSFRKPNFKIKLLDTLQIALAMN